MSQYQFLDTESSDDSADNGNYEIVGISAKNGVITQELWVRRPECPKLVEKCFMNENSGGSCKAQFIGKFVINDKYVATYA